VSWKAQMNRKLEWKQSKMKDIFGTINENTNAEGQFLAELKE